MSDMKCPFCNGKLYGCIGHPYCRNEKCEMCDEMMPQELLDLLERTRKALDIAIDALKEYADKDNWSMGFTPWAEDGTRNALYTEDGYKTAENALEQITALEQKE